MAAAERGGADVDILTASELDLPSYAPQSGPIGAAAERLVELVAACDGLIIATPGFHGGPSGLLKNALDYLEALRSDPRPYLDGRAVACVVCAAGWQATATTLVSMRSTIHALRGWPTPLGVTINSRPIAGAMDDPVERATAQLELAAEQVIGFARGRQAASALELEAVRT
jgi:FMN reductase